MAKSFSVKSFGCSANIAEGEIVQGLLSEKGFEQKEENDAELLVVNVCTVKGDTSSQKEIRSLAKKYPGKKILVTGCVTPSLRTSLLTEFPNISITSTHSIKSMPEFAEQTLHGIQITDQKKPRESKAALPRIRQNSCIGIVPISSGCLDTCSFCSTVLVKGRLLSYPVEDLVTDVNTAVQAGCKEIWLTGQDAACYGFEFGKTIVDLLKEIVKIPGEFRVRIGMGNPRHIPKYINELCEIMQHPKIFKFLHLPLQSGSTSVLKGMRRQHNVAEWEELVTKLRQRIPNITISTDIICGFPGETDEDFSQTLSLLEKARLPVINISRFVPRQHTKAAELENQISPLVKKRRSQELSAQFFRIAKEENEKWIGWKGAVTISEQGHIAGSWIARNEFYKPIAIKGNYALGQTVNITVTGATKYCCIAEEQTKK